MASVNIGESLRQARIKKNISLEELQQLTKVQKRYLMAIEDNEFDTLPSPFYARAFIRQYAETVGADGDYLVDVYDGKDQPVILRDEPEHIEGSRKGKHVADPKKIQLQASLPMIVLGLIALVIITIVAYYTWLDHKSAPLIAADSSVQVEGSVSTSTSESTKQTKSKPEETEESKSEEPAKPELAVTMEQNTNEAAQMKLDHVEGPLKIEFTGQTHPCWVGIMVNNQLIYQHTLQPQEVQSAELPAGTANALITVGSANEAKIKVDDKDLDFQPNPEVINKKNINLTINYQAAEQPAEQTTPATEGQDAAQAAQPVQEVQPTTPAVPAATP